MNICRINRYVYLLIAVTSLAACTSTVETSKPSASKFEENTGILREGKKLKGIPYPEFSYVLVEGVLTTRPGAEKCLPTRVTQRQFQPTGEVLLVKMPIRPWTVFADSELSVEFFNNGLPKLISANSKNAAVMVHRLMISRSICGATSNFRQSTKALKFKTFNR